MARQRTGFTLIELLVALLVASILVMMVYQVYAKAAAGYRVQNMALEMQAQARFGLEHLRRDVGNAGFNGTTNTAVDNNLCFQPATVIQAIKLGPNDGDVVDPTGANKFIQPTSITLFGDYAGNGEVLITQSVSGSTITLSQGTGPTDPVNYKNRITQVQFEDMFAAPSRRYVRLVDENQFDMLLPVSSASWLTGTITTVGAAPAKGNGQTCGVAGFGLGMEVNSAMFIRYRLTRDTRTGADPGKIDLVKEEIQTDGTTPVAGTRLIIAEHAVDLAAYDFYFDADTTGTQPTLEYFPRALPTVLTIAGGGYLGVGSTRVQDLRFMTLKLTVRTILEDEKLPHRERTTISAPIHTYDVDTTLEGSARTLSLASKVMLNTLAVRNVQP